MYCVRVMYIRNSIMNPFYKPIKIELNNSRLVLMTTINGFPSYHTY